MVATEALEAIEAIAATETFATSEAASVFVKEFAMSMLAVCVEAQAASPVALGRQLCLLAPSMVELAI